MDRSLNDEALREAAKRAGGIEYLSDCRAIVGAYFHASTPVAWMATWPGTVHGETPITRTRSIAEIWEKGGADITPLFA